ncbi:MAG: hypothetical protein ACRDKV_07400, partial [Solirubrobacterales bacterium]
PLDPSGEGTVRVLEDRIVVDGLTISDRDTARVVRERAETGTPPAETVIKSIEIGARVLEREGTAAEVDYVKAEFGKHTAELAERLAKTLEGGSDQLAEEIAKTFGADRQGTVQHQIKEMLVRFAELQRDSLARQFSTSDGTNPLSDFKQGVVNALKEGEARRQREGEESRKRIEALTREIVELKEREQADRRVAEAEEAGTRKGLTFEEKVHDAIERIASLRGDAAAHTGAEQAEGGGKKGDTLVELGAADGPSGGRMLFEAKDKRLSRNDAWRELNEGMAARAAAFGVLVVADEERVPARCEQLHEYEGNKMIVAVDREEPSSLALEVAYRLAAARVTMARDTGLEVDPVAVRDTAQEAVSTLKQAQAIRSTLTGIKTSSDKARAGLDALVETVRARLERIELLVSEEAAKTESD